MKISSLAPSSIWENFSKLNAIPRPSKKEGKVIAYIEDFGKSLGLDTTIDKIGNLIIRKKATKGMESRQPVILQSHVDMVCQKKEEVKFDFERDGIKAVISGDWVTAKGTTLGADNGIGVATIMSVLESTDIPHPPLEALFTVDEETGMTGAFGLKPGMLEGRILLNLDTEEEDEIDIGCAGGIDITARKSLKTEIGSFRALKIDIHGLQGGHSGIDIDKGRANANLLLRRLLFLGLDFKIQLAHIDSGGVRNAIPRDAIALIKVDDTTSYLEAAMQLRSDILEEFKSIEKDLEITFEESDYKGSIVSPEESERIILALKAAHNGVYRMSPGVKDLVETSNNIARIALSGKEIRINCLARSSVESSKMDVANQLKACFHLAGMDVAFSGSYPGWEPDLNSGILKLLENIYIEKFGTTPKVIACHAGLECGIIGAHYPDMQMISFGPTIKGAHTPEEKVRIKSVQKFWSFLKEILKNIPEKA